MWRRLKVCKVMNYVAFRSDIANSDMYIPSWKIDWLFLLINLSLETHLEKSVSVYNWFKWSLDK